MRLFLFFACLMFIQICSADVIIDDPQFYDDLSPILSSEIDHYEICMSNDVDDVCDETLSISDRVIKSDQIPNAKFLKAKTVDIFGRRSAEWSNTFRIKSPLPPNLSIKIIIEIGV